MTNNTPTHRKLVASKKPSRSDQPSAIAEAGETTGAAEPPEPAEPDEPDEPAAPFISNRLEHPSSSHAASAPLPIISIPHKYGDTWWKKFISKLRLKNKEKDKWKMPAYVCIEVGDNEVRRTGVLMFDTGSPIDMISDHFLKKFRGHTLQTSPEAQVIGTGITGRETYTSLGRIDLRWWARNPGKRSLDRTLHLRPRFEDSSCHIIESKEFDLIIGRNTIDRLNLFEERTSLIAPVRYTLPSGDIEDVKKVQKIADAEREKEKKDKKQQREKEKKEREQRNQNPPP